MDPVPDPLLLRKSGSAGNQTRASGSVARNCDYETTEAVGNRPQSSKFWKQWTREPALLSFCRAQIPQIVLRLNWHVRGDKLRLTAGGKYRIYFYRVHSKNLQN
jgi:hypothetical protein